MIKIAENKILFFAPEVFEKRTYGCMYTSVDTLRSSIYENMRDALLPKLISGEMRIEI